MAVTDLTNTSWCFNDTISVFSASRYNINFVNYGITYHAIRRGEGSLFVALGGWYESNGSESPDTWYYSDSGWRSGNVYRYITITGGEDVQNTTLINWLNNNATQVKASIAYNDAEIAEVNLAQTLTIECLNKKAITNIVISNFGATGVIVYNDNKTMVKADKTAILECAEKKMLSNVVVKLPSHALYNGEQLPIISAADLSKTPYCFIRKNNSTGYYDLVFDISPWSRSGSTINPSSSSRKVLWLRVKIDAAETASCWIYNQEATGGFGIDTNRPLLWANHDILDGSAIYLKGTEPVPVV